MQEHTGNSCGVLTHMLMKRLQAQIVPPNEHLAFNTRKQLESVIVGHVNDWIARPAVDQRAAVLAGRAELLEAWAANKPQDAQFGRPGAQGDIDIEGLGEALLKAADGPSRNHYLRQLANLSGRKDEVGARASQLIQEFTHIAAGD